MKRTALALALVAALVAPLAAQQPLDLANQIQVTLDALKLLLAPPPPPAITTVEGFNAALAAGQTTIVVSNQFVYPSLLIVSQPVTITAETLPAPVLDANGYLIGLTGPAPVFADGIKISASVSGVLLQGLEIRKVNHTVDIVEVLGASVTLFRNRVLGDPVAGAKRGIAAHANGNLTITENFVEDCFQSYPGNDSQALFAWDMLPGLLVEGNWLSGGSESVMIGGADSTSPDRDPRNITLRRNVITKNAAWQGLAIGVKNTFELKNARNVLVEYNDIRYSWKKGQDGYAVAFTVRNQSNTNPTASIQDVTFRHNLVAHAAAAINVLGKDDVNASEQMARVTIDDNAFTDISSALYSASLTKKLILIDRAPIDLHITNNPFASTGHTSTIYFVGNGGALTGFVFTGNTYPKTTYGMFGAAVSVNQAFATYAPGGVTSPNTELVP